VNSKISIARAFFAVFALVLLVGYASAAAGTRDDPIPMGTPVNLRDAWTITVLSIMPDATQAILKENMFNDPPKAGNQFFMARVRGKLQWRRL